MMGLFRMNRSIIDPVPGQVWLAPGTKPMMIVEIDRDVEMGGFGAVMVVYANWVFEDGWDRTPSKYCDGRRQWRDYLKQERRYLK